MIPSEPNKNVIRPRMIMTRDHTSPFGEAKLLEIQKLASQGFSIEAIKSKITQSPIEERLDKWITGDPDMNKVKDKIRQIYTKDSESPVLITGPTGTGKELLARAFLFCKDGVEVPFVAINCGALTRELINSEFFGHRKGSFTGAMDAKPGLLVQAGEGIVFLDEIAELPLNLQVTLLRAIQEGIIYPVGSVMPIEIHCRFIAATHQNLEKQVELGIFREDLYARLFVHELKITGLKDRPDDIKLIAISLGWTGDIPEEAMKKIYKYNVRGIQAFVKRMEVYGTY